MSGDRTRSGIQEKSIRLVCEQKAGWSAYVLTGKCLVFPDLSGYVKRKDKKSWSICTKGISGQKSGVDKKNGVVYNPNHLEGQFAGELVWEACLRELI